MAASMTARRSVEVTPAGTETITSGLKRFTFAQRLVDEVSEHRLGHAVVGDDAVFHRAVGDDGVRRAADHLLGLDADRQDLVVLLGNGDDGRLIEDDALARHEDQGVGRAQSIPSFLENKLMNMMNDSMAIC